MCSLTIGHWTLDMAHAVIGTFYCVGVILLVEIKMNKPTNCSKTFTTINRIMRKCPHHYLVSFSYCRYLNYLNLDNEESVLFKNSYLRKALY